MIIDFHTHVLPGIDDGSRDIDESKCLLEEELKQGVEYIIATPHFYAVRTSFQSFLEKREKAYQSIRSVSPVQILKAAEVYYFPGMGNADQLREFTIEGTDLLMLEMPFAQWTSEIVEDLRLLIYKQKLSVILVHLERYYAFQKKKEFWENVLELPLAIQLNAGSLLEWRGRRFDLRLMKTGRPVVLGTDCHNMKSRKPNMGEGRAVIEKKLGAGMLEQIDCYGTNLLKEHGLLL